MIKIATKKVTDQIDGIRVRKMKENLIEPHAVEDKRKSDPTNQNNPSRNLLNQNLRLTSMTKKKSRNSPSRRKKSRNSNKGDKKTRNSPSGSKHDMPMGKKDLYFALDCEMVGVGPYGAESALARVSIVNWDCDVILDTFVKVPVPVTDYRTFVSGVRSQDIESCDAMDLKQVRAAVQNILRGKILIGHALENDFKALNITHPWCDTRDTAFYSPFMRETVNSQTGRIMIPRRLKDLAKEELGKEIQALGDAHSSVEDAITALELYKAHRPQWEAHMSEQVKKANDLENSRLQKIANYARRRVQPMPMYQQTQPKIFQTSSFPASNPNMHLKGQTPIYYIPTQNQVYYRHIKPHMSPYPPLKEAQHGVDSNFSRQFIPSN